MPAIAIIVILLAIAITIAATVALRSWRQPGGPAQFQPGPGNPGLAGPASPPHVPGPPGFLVHPDPGFTVVRRSGVRGGATAGSNGARKPAAAGPKGFQGVEITQNMNAFCKLTGRQVAECGCEMHRGKLPKGKR